jgi:quercetin dioxygenase-like cupin family protein
MFFSYPTDFKMRELAPGIRSYLAWGEKLMFSLVYLEPNTAIGRHRHEHEQMGLVLEGTLEITVGSESRVLSTGDAYVVASNVEHNARTFGESAQVLDAFAPPREDYK